MSLFPLMHVAFQQPNHNELTCSLQADDLVRIRNNQRRSRARKQEYIASLEARIKAYEDMDSCLDDRESNLERIYSENAALRKLLASQGFDAETQKAYLAMELSNSEGACRFLEANMGDNPIVIDDDGVVTIREVKFSACVFSKMSLTRPQDNNPLSPTLRTSDEPPNQLLDPFLSNMPQHNTLQMPEPDPNISFASIENCHMPANLLSPISLQTLPQHSSSKDTTLCSVAYSLILQYNRKGLNIVDLDLKLRAGYRMGSIMEGCSLDNKLLFQVLADIS